MEEQSIIKRVTIDSIASFVEFDSIMAICKQSTTTNGVMPTLHTIIIPYLLAPGVFFQDDKRKIVKFTESMKFVYEDIFHNRYEIRAKMPVSAKTGNDLTKKDIKNIFHIGKIQVKDNFDSILYAKLYMYNSTKKRKIDELLLYPRCNKVIESGKSIKKDIIKVEENNLKEQ